MTGLREIPMRGSIERGQLETAEPGVWMVAGTAIPNDRLYDVTRGEFTEGDTILLARVDHGTYLPKCIEEARFRADGKRLVVFRALSASVAGPWWEPIPDSAAEGD